MTEEEKKAIHFCKLVGTDLAKIVEHNIKYFDDTESMKNAKRLLTKDRVAEIILKSFYRSLSFSVDPLDLEKAKKIAVESTKENVN